MKLTIKSLVALALGAGLWAVETWLLVDATGYALSPQVAVVVMATIALAAAPLFFKEVSGGLRIAAWVGCGLLACFVFGAVLDRSSHTVRLAAATSESATESRGRVEAELASARNSLAHANAKVEAETNNGGCGAKCRVWQGYANGYQFAIDGFLAKLEALKPVVANTGVKTVADLTGVSERLVLLLWPIPQPMSFQLLIWFFLGLAFHRKTQFPATVSAPETEIGGGGKGLHLIQGGKVTNREIEALRNALSGNRVVTNDELATLMAVTKGEASKRVEVARAMGIVSKRRVGRHVAISLQHAH